MCDTETRGKDAGVERAVRRPDERGMLRPGNYRRLIRSLREAAEAAAVAESDLEMARRLR